MRSARKKFKVVVALIMLVLAVAVPAVLGYWSKVTADPLDGNLTGPVAPEVDVSPIVEANVEPVTELPALESINSNEEPLLYDFVSGCLDWHVPIYRDTLDSDLYILRHSSSPQILYTDWYVTQGGYTVPPTGTSIERVELAPRDLDKFETILSTISSDYIIEDGDWQLIIYAGEAASALNKLDLGLRKDYPYAEGRVPPFVEKGLGWPTAWLRREPYASRLASESGIDIQDGWWDKFCLEGRYDLQPTGVSDETHDYYAICTGIMEFSFCDDEGNVARGMSWDLLRETCNAMYANIPGIYVSGSWQQETAYDSVSQE